MHITSTVGLCGALAVVLVADLAHAQEPASQYPSKPVSIVLPFTPGGSTDVEAREYGDALAKALGKPFVLDYKPGGGGVLAYTHTAKSAPDGYTVVFAGDALTISMAMDKDLPYDPKSLQPISMMTKWTQMMVAGHHLPIGNAKDYFAYGRANPGKINWGDSGLGGVSHLVGVLINSLAGVNVTYVHYKGTAQLYLDMIAGRVDATSGRLLGTLPAVKSGKAKALAVSSARRSPLLPDVPTLQEAGLKGYDNNGWVGFMGPGGMPPATLKKLVDTLIVIAKAPENVRKKINEGGVAVGSTPAEFREYIANETAKWQEIVTKYKIQRE
jgi:tripartite-type tricarboxylate transporter receptor subunit TctC